MNAMAKVHGVLPTQTLDAHAGESVAQVMKVLATASRVRIVAELRTSSRTVGELATAVDMTQPAVSHQLRILRDLGIVVGRRDGHHIHYELNDDHIATLLDEALRHLDHLTTNTSHPHASPSPKSKTQKERT